MANENSADIHSDLPGGTIGFRKKDTPVHVQDTVERLKEGLHGDEWAFPPMRDPDFIDHFAAKVQDPDEQLRYAQETAKYLDRDTSADLSHVLVFRRTLPSDTPKPEEHWTTDYITARNGLRLEIPEGPHRLHSVILCSTLEDVLSNGLADEANMAESDGEIKISAMPYDQKNSLVIFRPADQQRKLDNYIEQEDAVTLDTIRTQLKELKE